MENCPDWATGWIWGQNVGKSKIQHWPFQAWVPDMKMVLLGALGRNGFEASRGQFGFDPTDFLDISKL